MCQLGIEKNTTDSLPAFLVHPSSLQVPDQREPVAKSHSLFEAKSQATYSSGDVEESRGDTGGDCEVTRSEEVELPVANGRLSLPVENRRELRQTKQRRSRYTCGICDKRFVYQRSFKNHMRMHETFSCLLRNEELKRHKLCQVKETPR